MAINPCFCWNIKDGTVIVGLWSLVYCIVQLALFSWQSYVIKNYRDIAANQLIPGHNTYAAYNTPSYFENYYHTPLTIFYTGIIFMMIFYTGIISMIMIYGLIQLAIFGWQTAAIKYEKDRAADSILPNYNEYGRLDIPSYYESYWQNPEERFYIGLFVIQILCLIASFFLLFASCSLIYGAHFLYQKDLFNLEINHCLFWYSKCLIWPWLPCMIASILCTLTYCIMWWSGDVRDYWLVLTILEMITVLINIYCVVVVSLFCHRISDEKIHCNAKKRMPYYRPRRMYDEFRNDNYINNHLPELDQPVKSGYRKNESSRHDQYNRLQDYTMIQQSAPVTPTQIRKTTFADDLVSTWVKEQQSIKDLPDHANSEPITQQKPEDICSLKHSYSVPSIYAKTSGTRCCCHRHRHKRCHHCHHHHHHHHRHHHHHHKQHSGARRQDQGDHDRRRNSLRHRHRFPSLTYSSGSVSTDCSDDSCLLRHHSRSLENDSMEANDLKMLKGYKSRRSKIEDDHDDSQRFRDRRRDSRKSKRNQYDVKQTVLRDTSDNASPTVAVQTDSVPTTHWPLDPQKGLSLPHQIIIPPSRGIIGPDGRPQPQTFPSYRKSPRMRHNFLQHVHNLGLFQLLPLCNDYFTDCYHHIGVSDET
ncbi:Inner membrane protein ALBINO3, chloroplastic [Dirofilaria immitis]